MINLNFRTASSENRVFYQRETIRRGRQLLEILDSFMRTTCLKESPVFIANTSLTETEFLSYLRESNFSLSECSDGDHSVIQDNGSAVDFSQKGGCFDLHQDGLGNKDLPDIAMLFCVSPGKQANPTFFCDTLEVIEKVAEDEQAFEVLKSLEFVYIDKSGRQQAHPFVAVNSHTGAPYLHLGSRGYLRQQSVDYAPSIREISKLLQKIFALADDATFLEHVWQKGDVAIWDNRRLLHGRGGQVNDRERKLVRLLLNR
jgi:alpha-ketoglutarate-dependent taurine dioxygenase